jgi:hypothetical protein
MQKFKSWGDYSLKERTKAAKDLFTGNMEIHAHSLTVFSFYFKKQTKKI